MILNCATCGEPTDGFSAYGKPFCNPDCYDNYSVSTTEPYSMVKSLEKYIPEGDRGEHATRILTTIKNDVAIKNFKHADIFLEKFIVALADKTINRDKIREARQKLNEVGFIDMKQRFLDRLQFTFSGGKRRKTKRRRTSRKTKRRTRKKTSRYRY